MTVVFDNIWTELLLFFSALVAIVLLYFKHAYSYWSRRGIYTIKPTFPLGNANTFFPKGFSVGALTRKFYEELKRDGHKVGGVYFVTEPQLVLADPDYVRDIMAKDFSHFVNRGFYYHKENDPLSAHLFAIEGSDWRNLRIKLTPTFTSGKMKMMFHIVIDNSKNLIEAIDKGSRKDVDIKELVSKFTTDVIGSCAFGIECNSFKNPDAEFRKMGHRIFEYGPIDILKYLLILYLPNFAWKLGVSSNKDEVSKFFINSIADTVKYRQEHNVERRDFLQLLMDISKTTDFSVNEMAAQSFLFFVAGFESSSTTMAFALYELAKNPEQQDKLRQEINNISAQHDNQITYEGLMDMKYLAQVVDETLRMYPPLATLNRRCTKKYTLRDSNIVIEEGTRILIPSWGLHRDPDIYPDPDKFDPERFSVANKKDRHPFVHLPFGDGPRNCLAVRFGEMQTRIGVACVIKNFKVAVSAATKPLRFDESVFLLSPLDTIWLSVERV